MTYSEVMLNSMTADELIRGLENGIIESLNAEMVLRIIRSFESTKEENNASYSEGYADDLADGREEALKDAMGALENL